MHSTIVAKELNVLNRYCKQLNILEDYLHQYQNETFSPRILMSGNIRNEKIDQIGLTLGIDVKAHIRELFAAEWKKEYGSNKDLYNKTPDVLKIKGDISELLEMIRKKKKVYYSWKEKVLYIAAKKGNLKAIPMHPPAHKIHGVWMECVIYGNRRFHIFLTPLNDIKLIDTAKAMKKKSIYPNLIIKGLDDLGCKEEFLNFIQTERPEIYARWLKYRK